MGSKGSIRVCIHLRQSPLACFPTPRPYYTLATTSFLG